VAEADALLDKALRCVSDATPAVHLLLLGDVLLSFGRYSDAADVYERVAEPTLDSHLTFRLITSYFEAGRLDQALDVCRKLRAAHGALRRVCEIESAIYEETGDLPAARRSCEDYLAAHPDDAKMRVQLAVVSLRQRKDAEVEAFLASPPEWTDLPVDYARQIANLYAFSGRHREALRLLYEVRRRFPEGKVHLNYIHAFLFHGEESLDWLEVDDVTVDTAVLLEDLSGKKQWYVIEDRSDSNVENNELPITHRLAQEVLGKRVGDKVTLSEGSIAAEIGTVLEVKSKYLHAFHQSAEALPVRYPEVKGFEAVHLAKAGDESTPDIQRLLDVVEKRHKGIHSVVQVYSDHAIPIGALARHLGCNVYEAWAGLLGREGRGIVCSIGTIEEREGAIRRLAEHNSQLIVDPVALMTLHGCGVAEDVLRIVGRLGIAQSTVDLVNETFLIRNRANVGGHLTLWKEGDQFVKREITDREVEEGRVHLETLLRWIDVNCDILPWPTTLRISRIERQRYAELLGKESFDTVLVAREAGRLLFSDDQRLRALASQEFGVDGVWTQPILMVGVDEGIVEAESHAKSLIRLVCAGYRLVSIDARTLLEAAKLANWRVTHPYDRVVDQLGGDFCDGESAIVVAVQFLFELWSTAISPMTSDYLVLRLFDALKRGRRLVLMVGKLEKMIRQRFFLVPFAGQQFLRVLRAWVEMQVWQE
jgi:hypothetical protein